MQDQAKDLKTLGNNVVPKYTSPSFEMLEVFPNLYQNREYQVQHNTSEFTSLCPKTSQPDFAEIRITYTPATLCIETKSLKMYLFAYRNEKCFMETTVNRILEDLVKCCNPTFMSVVGTFGPRGGIRTTVEAHYDIDEVEEESDGTDFPSSAYDEALEEDLR